MCPIAAENTSTSRHAPRSSVSPATLNIGTAGFQISFTILLFCFFVGILQINAPAFLRDPDTLWHIRVGEWMLDHHQIPTTDLFSYTSFGKHWVNTEWLSDLIYAIAFRIGGFQAVVLLASACSAAILTVVSWFLLSQLRFSVAIAWGALTMLAVSHHLLARPHIFSYLILVIWVIILLHAYDRNDFGWRTVWKLIPLVIFWANLHGSFTYGIMVLYAFSSAAILKNWSASDRTIIARIIVLTLLVTASSLLTPYGYQAAFATFEVLQMKHAVDQVQENMSPNFQLDKIHLVLFLAILGGLLGFGVRVTGARLIVFLSIAAIGLSYTRGLAMFFLLAPILLARPFSQAHSFFRKSILTTVVFERRDRLIEFAGSKAIAIVLALCAVASVTSISIFWREDIEPPADIAPRAALDFVRRENIQGNVFNSYNFGGFLIASNVLTFVDGRAFPFGDEFLNDYFQASSVSDIRQTSELLDRFKVKWTLLSPQEPITRALAVNPQWRLAYSDKYAVVFVRINKD